jgi:predicted dehydrogenase
LVAAARDTQGFLSVGYNRRFSPHAEKIRETFDGRSEPMSIRYTVAAGATPAGTWVTDPKTGGGRIIGECCHFIDLCIYLVGTLPSSVYARGLSRDPERDDSFVANVSFTDGSVATLEYLANASAELPKERFEVSSERKTAICENFRSTTVMGGTPLKTLNQNKGQREAVLAVIEACRTGAGSPFTLEELTANSETTFGILESMRTGQAVDLTAKLAAY